MNRRNSLRGELYFYPWIFDTQKWYNSNQTNKSIILDFFFQKFMCLFSLQSRRYFSLWNGRFLYSEGKTPGQTDAFERDMDHCLGDCMVEPTSPFGLFARGEGFGTIHCAFEFWSKSKAFFFFFGLIEEAKVIFLSFSLVEEKLATEFFSLKLHPLMLFTDWPTSSLLWLIKYR